MEVKFVKMHGIGNDFILMDFFNKQLPAQINFNEVAKKICQRHFGIGADGLILILPSDKYDFRMRILNFDGSEAQMCGNGIRCFARYVYQNKLTDKTKFSVETLAGKIIPRLIFGSGKDEVIEGIKVDMGEPHLWKKEIPMKGTPDSKTINETILLDNNMAFKVTCVSMGNPHCVIFVDSVETFPVTTVGPVLEKYQLFPEKTNVEFVQILNRNELNFRVWERGVGETMACGTGACAALVAGVLNKSVESNAVVHLKGGDLAIQWADDNHIYMTGPAEFVFQGSIHI